MTARIAFFGERPAVRLRVAGFPASNANEGNKSPQPVGTKKIGKQLIDISQCSDIFALEAREHGHIEIEIETDRVGIAG